MLSAPDVSGRPQLGRKMTLAAKKTVFDAEDFDAVRFINQIYPDESSLSDLDRFTDMLRKQIRAVDKEIFQSVRQQSGAHTRARQDLGTATAQISELFTKVRDIQSKAEETEAMVQEICRDIKKLDLAKRHLTNAITSLRRLAMLTAAVTDLEAVAYRRDQYKRCADLLEAVSQLMDYFQQYEQVPKIKSLTKRLGAVQSALQEGVLDDFKILMGSADVRLTAENLERLANACLVINALGPKVRDSLLDWLCDREMTIYQTIFSMSGDAAKLDRFERRFHWFKSRLEEKKEQWAIFPDSWRVPQTLCLTFCKITKAHLKRILSDSEGAVREDVGPLIKTVVATNKFEREMAATFGGGTLEEDDDDLQDVDNLPASEARRRLEAYRKKMQVQAAAKAAAQAGEQAKEAAEAVKTAFEGSISDAFEDSLKWYVAEEERELRAYLDTCIREEAERKWVPADEEMANKVLSSSTKLFIKIKSSLARCVKLVSRGLPLLKLSEAFKVVLNAYAGELLKRLPKTANGLTSASPPWVGTDWHIRVPDEEEKLCCYILHTAEYCRETVEGLAAAIQKDIKPAFTQKVEMTDEENSFINVASQSLSVLVLGVNTRLDAALLEMQKMPWGTIDTPGDDSAFVNTARKVLLDCAPRLGMELDRTHFSFFCDKMVRMFVPRYADSVYKLRKISEKGTLQLSIDTDAIKRMLLDFPRAARPLDEDGADLANYAHYVEREMGGVVNLVKVLQAKPENLVDTFVLLMPANYKTPADFVRVCELKALQKKTQQDLLIQFQRKMGDPISFPSASTPPLPSVSMAPAASNLSAFKLNMNSFTRELASSLGAGARDKGLPTGAARGGAGAGGTSAAQRAKEGFAKVSTFTASILPGKLAGSHGDLTKEAR